MARLEFAEAIDTALATAMAADERVVVWGEDVHLLRRELLVRFGPRRVRATPISESAFLGAAVGAAMAGLRPVVEVMLVDFLGVAFDALLNHAAKVEAFSGGRWTAPLVVRSACGGGYGDGGQHEQCLWGMLGGIPGLSVVVPSDPADAAGLLLAAVEHDGPVVFLEHKLLSAPWLEYLGSGRRDTVRYDVPPDGATGEVPEPLRPVPLGRAAVRRDGADLAILSLGVGVHRSLEAAAVLAGRGVGCRVVDLRSVAPLDAEAVLGAARATGRVLVVDEDYLRGGLSGEVAALLAEAGVPARYARVCTETTIPYARHLEDETLPNMARILEAVDCLLR
ncbi:MAG: pyruvate dehydrogenase [Acidimicrobiia bacterium]|nr:pyruvate dehydrogenase [Acidimicrobiia bacterium]